MTSTATPAHPFTLSVLDLVPVHTGQSSSEAIAASMALARVADEAGYRRYWFAEHHNMPAVASTNPAVLIALAAGHTQRIRLGSGGVMLPNHAPLIVAEQFAALEAANPGRIDLGLGRAPGSDPVVNALLRSSGPTSQVEAFPDHVNDVIRLLEPAGAVLRLAGDREYPVRATPQATSTPEVWLLGSSDYSAQLAARFGLPYVFANHFAGEGVEAALALYRGGFTPQHPGETPRTFLTANVVVADTDDDAQRLALPHLIQMARLRTGVPLGPQLTVEKAEAAPLSDAEQQIIATARSRWYIGTPTAVHERLREFASRLDVDEVMIVPVAGTHAQGPTDRAVEREATLTLLAEAHSTASAR